MGYRRKSVTFLKSVSALKGYLSTNIFWWKPLRIGTLEISIENILKIEQFGFSLQYDYVKEADRRTNSEDLIRLLLKEHLI